MTIVDEQIEAYNKQDIEKFLNCYTDTLEVYMLEKDVKLTDGKDQLRTVMTAAFKANPESRTTVISRMNQSNLKNFSTE